MCDLKILDSFILGKNSDGQDIIVSLEQHTSKSGTPFKSCALIVGNIKSYIGFDRQYYILRKILKRG